MCFARRSKPLCPPTTSRLNMHYTDPWPMASSSATLPHAAPLALPSCFGCNQFLCAAAASRIQRYLHRIKSNLVRVRVRSHSPFTFMYDRCRDGAPTMFLQIQSSARGITYARPMAKSIAMYRACSCILHVINNGGWVPIMRAIERTDGVMTVGASLHGNLPFFPLVHIHNHPPNKQSRPRSSVQTLQYCKALLYVNTPLPSC